MTVRRGRDLPPGSRPRRSRIGAAVASDGAGPRLHKIPVSGQNVWSGPRASDGNLRSLCETADSSAERREGDTKEEGLPEEAFLLVGMGGVEPPRPFGHTDLNRARLPFRHIPLGTMLLSRGVCRNFSSPRGSQGSHLPLRAGTAYAMPAPPRQPVIPVGVAGRTLTRPPGQGRNRRQGWSSCWRGVGNGGRIGRRRGSGGQITSCPRNPRRTGERVATLRETPGRPG